MYKWSLCGAVYFILQAVFLVVDVNQQHLLMIYSLIHIYDILLVFNDKYQLAVFFICNYPTLL